MSDSVLKRNAGKSTIAELRSLSNPERLLLLAALDTQELHDAEKAKTHPLVQAKFTAGELAQLRSHLLDGGGVKDDGELRQMFVQAVIDGDWATVLREIPHVVKSWINQRGDVIAPAGNQGGVVMNGFGASPIPDAFKPGFKKE